MKVFFVIPKNKSMLGHKDNPPGFPHIGIAYLGSFLRKNGHNVRVYDDGLKNPRSLIESVKEFNPGLIGITSFSYCYDYALACIKELKSFFSIPIVLGGPHVSVAKGSVFSDAEVDFAIKREGEQSLLQLVQTLEKQERDFSGIANLLWKKNEKVYENLDMPFIDNLDALPFPDFSLFEVEKYTSTQLRSTALITSRGCPYLCTYCSTLLSMGRGFRKRSAENVFAEIELRYEEGYRNFDINDDCFSLDLDRAHTICDLVIKSGYEVRFQCYNGLRVDRINLDLLKKMKKAGFYFIALGCESGDPDVLKSIKKSITLDQVRNAVLWAREAGIDCAVNFIIGHPAETYQQALNTIHFAKSLKSNYINFSNLIPYPGTEAFLWAEKHAHFLVEKQDYLRSLSTYDDNPIFETKEFTAKQRKKISRLGHELYYKKVLLWRLGRPVGLLIYYLTRIPGFRTVMSDFALNKKLGRFIFIVLSGRYKFLKQASEKQICQS